MVIPMGTVDVQHHFYLESRPTKPVDEHLAFMEQHRLDMAILTNLLPEPDEKNISFYEKMNNELLQLSKIYPERFIPCPSIPIHSGKAAVEELDRVTNTHEVRCCHIRPLRGRIDRAELDPFYQKVTDLGIPILVHPTYRDPQLMELLEDNKFKLAASVGFMINTTVAIGWLIFSGLLERFPKLKLIFHHLGGTTPFLLGRLEAVYEESDAKIPKRPTEYFKKLYFDTVAYTQEPLELTCKLVGPDHLLLGTDYGCPTKGLVRPTEFIQMVNNLKVSEMDKERILGGNAMGLLGLGNL